MISAKQKKTAQIALDKKAKQTYLKELQISDDQLKAFVRSKKISQKKKKVEFKEYSVYKSNFYAKISNNFMENLTFIFTIKFPKIYQKLSSDIQLANLQILTKTYISIMFFSSIISFPIITIFSFILFGGIFRSLLFGFLSIFLTLLIFYYYPYSTISGRNKKIKSDLVYATIHMAAISGSGAQPLKIFKLLLDSHEYRNLESEIKKILNYVNLFGYSLSNALKAVSLTTPSYELKELLNGMVSSIETGGDIRNYLQEKAKDTLNTYKLDQQKHVSILSTYSDIYTGVFISAPLLFLVTMAILDKISPTIGNMSIATIATIGTFGLIPFVNVLFIIFMNITQPEL